MTTLTRYALVGIGTTLLDFVVYAIGVTLIGWPKLGAHALATAIALPLSFVGQRNMAFRSQGKLTRQAVEFITVVLTNVTLVQPLVIAAVPWPMAAKVAAIVVGITWNFVWFNGLIFSTRRGRRG